MTEFDRWLAARWIDTQRTDRHVMTDLHAVTTPPLAAIPAPSDTERAATMSYTPPALAVPPRRPRRWPWIVGVIAVLAAVSIGGAVLQHKPAPAATPAPSTTASAAAVIATVTVPTDLVGRNAGDAKSELAQAGLVGQLEAASPACADTIQPPSGCVVTSVPDAGQRVQGGGTVRVVIDMAPTTSAPAVVNDTDTVTYSVTGRSAGTITYENAGGDASQVTNTTRLPWTVSFTVPIGAEGFLYVSAQNASSGLIGCSISVNGQIVKQNTSTGAYAIVDCSN